MKKKIICVLSLLGLVTCLIRVDATSGKISGKKVIECSGKNYGRHGKDEHWHKAEMRGDSWYAIGPDLGYQNPCPSTPSNDNTSQDKVTQTQSQKNNTDQSAKGKGANQNNTEKQKQERIEKQEKEKSQKLAADRESAEKIELQESDTTIYSIALSGFDSSTSSVYFYNNLEEDLKNSLATKDTTYSIETDIQAKPFIAEDIKVLVTSKNKKNSKGYKYRVARLGTQDELTSQKLVLSLGDQNYDYVDGRFAIPYKEVKKPSVKAELLINNICITDLSLENLENNNSISLTIGNHKYSMPTKPLENDSNNLGSLALLGTFVLAGSGTYYYKKKTRKV